MLVYKATNKVNGKSYVGQTIHTLMKRKQEHISAAKLHRDNYYFHNALRKHNIDNFDWEIIYDNINNIDELNKLEIFYIDYYGTFKSGYNLDAGGKNALASDETKRKMSLANIGQNNPNYGKKSSAETRKKMSVANSGENHPNYGKYGKNSPVARTVIINNKHFDTLTKAAEFVGVKSNTMIYRIRHKTKWMDYHYLT